MSRYLAPIKWLGGSASIAFILALVFPLLRDALFSEDVRGGVLLQAIPFFGAFVGVLLLFILVIILTAMRFNGKMPYRAYRPVETVIITGILAGVAFLFQPLHFVGYKYGFVLLLVSTLAFILWSHIIPRGAKQDDTLPPIAPFQHTVGVIAGVLVLVVLTYSVATFNQPVSPFGIRQRLWDTYPDERKAEITAQAVGDYQNIELPFLVVFNLFPAVAIYLITREAAGMTQDKNKRSAAV